MNAQITDTVLMVRPASFCYNEQTAVNNFYQKKGTDPALQSQALKSFDVMVNNLQQKGVKVIVVEDTAKPETPDAIFPNNWISFHADGKVAIYPMYAKNRRLEREDRILQAVEAKGFIIDEIIDYTSAESHGVFLEGTGSMVLDRKNSTAFMAISPRSDEDLFVEFCEDFEFTPIFFSAYQTVDEHRVLIYHTNVMMCIAEEYVVICLEAIDNKKERKIVARSLLDSGRELIEITEVQLNHFAGNMLQVKGTDQNYIVMSTAAYASLSDQQISRLESYNPIIHTDLTVIEENGGGSARCMIAEIFLPQA